MKFLTVLILDGSWTAESCLHRDPGAHVPHYCRFLADGLGTGKRSPRNALQVQYLPPPPNLPDFPVSGITNSQIFPRILIFIKSRIIDWYIHL